jgi:hypothetical protein
VTSRMGTGLSNSFFTVYFIPRVPECLCLRPNWLLPSPVPQTSVPLPELKGKGGWVVGQRIMVIIEKYGYGTVSGVRDYTVKKAFRYSRPQQGCHLLKCPWAGIMTLYMNYSRLGRVW